MRRNPILFRLLALGLMSGVPFLTSCNDNDYDLSDIDATIGIGGDKLEIPVSSTNVIKLADVLELEENGSVVEDANGDYLFLQTMKDPVNAVHPNISKIELTLGNTYDHNLSFETASTRSNRVGTRAASYALKAEGRVLDIDYKYQKPTEVVKLLESETDAQIGINFTLPTGLGKLDKLKITLPEYMVLKEDKKSNYEAKGNVIEFTNTGSANATFSISKLDFTKGGNDLTIGSNAIELKGGVDVYALCSDPTGATSTNFAVKINITDLYINSATGYFKPTIELNDLGSVDIDNAGIPDFLKGGNVNIDLYNPQIKLTVSNDMDVEGKVDGILTAVKDGKTTARVNVNGIKVEANKTSKICICRNKEGMTGYDQVIEVPTLSTLISTIPDKISFAATAEANAEEKGSFVFGHTYTIQPSYAVEAPIAFAENANIEYKDTLDGWNDDVKDLKLSKDSYILATANVESAVPAYLSVEAIPVGVDHKPLSSDDIEVIVDGNIAASQDGKTTVTSPLSVKLIQKTEDAVKKLDGIVFLVSGKANGENGAVTGITLNAKKHSLVLNDVKIQLVGKVIGDFN